jgi:hypothetical protein
VSSKPPTRSVSDRPTDDLPFIRRILEKFARVLVLNGFSPRTLARVFADVCSHLDEPKHPRDPTRPAFTANLGHILSYWYTDPLCLDGRGRPRPLPASGRGLSVTELVRRTSPRLDPDEAIATLVKHRALKRRGALYVPSNRRILFDPRDAAAPARGLLPLEGLLDTLHRNWAYPGKRPDTLESTAINPAFPVRAVRALKKQVMDRGLAFLHEIDSTMRRSETRASASERRTRIGVSLFLFEDAQKKSVRGRPTSPAKRQ